MIDFTELSKQILKYLRRSNNEIITNEIPTNEIIIEDSNIEGEVTTLARKFPFEIGNLRFDGIVDSGWGGYGAIVNTNDFQNLIDRGYITSIGERRVSDISGKSFNILAGMGNISFYDDQGNPHMFSDLRIGAIPDSRYGKFDLVGLEFLKKFYKMEFYMEESHYTFKAEMLSK